MSTAGATVDEKSRTIEFPFSSELPVERYFGNEILRHDTRSIDLGRADLGALPLLFNHNTDDIRGKVESVRLGDDKRLYATVRYANTPAGEECLALVRDGMLSNVSFGYVISEMTRAQSNSESEPDTYIATKWTPYEVSHVTVPADPTVGVGRAATDEEFEVNVIQPIQEKGKETTMPPVTEEITKPAPSIDASKISSDAVAQERSRIASIQALGTKFDMGDLARQLVEGGKSVDEARGAFLEKMSVKQVALKGDEGEIGLSKKEKDQYSWMRGIRALANPTDRRAQEAAGFEFEVSRAGCKLRGKESEGIFVPQDVLVHSQKRALLKGTPSAGGYLVATELQPQSFIDLLRHKQALVNAGIRTMSGLVGDLAIPKQTGGATAYWVGEAVDVTGSSQTFGQVALAPKTLGAYTDLSRKLILQATPDAESIVVDDISRVLALALDLAGLYGSGSSSQPLGVANVPSIQTKDITNNAPTFPELVDMESKIAAADADVATMSYIVNAAMRGYMKSTVKFSSAGSATIWEPGNQINGYNAITSNQLTTGDVFFGNWNDLVLGLWSGIDLNVDNISLAKQGGLRLIVLQDVDYAVRHAESFCLGQ